MKTNLFYGWYDDAAQAADQPTYDPPHDGPCLLCGMPIDPEQDVRTLSMMMAEPVYAQRSYFYRTHRTCHEGADAAARDQADDNIWNMIQRNGD